MAMMGIRFDFRNPAFAGTTMADRYSAALEMCEWAERNGFASVTLSEHHGSEDGYLPGIVPLASAVAARTKTMWIQLAAIIAPLHEPLRLAEDLAVLDHLAQGRLGVVFANGYVPSEFTMFDKAMRDRPALVTRAVATMRKAWTGEPFEFEGRTARVTPRPFQPNGPAIALGGASDGAARRAARIADGFMPTGPQYWDTYRAEMVKLGKPDPGPFLTGTVSYVHITEDPDATWQQVAPYAMHEMNAYGAWAAESGSDTGYSQVPDADTLRTMGIYQLLTPDECVELIRGLGNSVFMLHPLMGGVPPKLAWENLRLFESKVLPRL